MWWLLPWALFVAGLIVVIATHLLRRQRTHRPVEAVEQLDGQRR
jgi:hypothetical protein